MNLSSITIVLLGLAGTAAVASFAADKPAPPPVGAAASPVAVNVDVQREADQGPAISVQAGSAGVSILTRTSSTPEATSAPKVEPAESAVPAPVLETAPVVAVPGVTVHAGRAGASVVVETPILPRVLPAIRVIRPAVVVASAPTGDRIGRLVERLRSGTPVLSQRAARVLIALGDPRAVEPLIGVLGDENPEVRRRAAEVLRSITGQDFGQDQGRWQAWYQQSLDQAVPRP